MGILEQVLAQVDNAKRVAGRNVQDLVSSPGAYADKIVGHLRNTNAGVSPTIAGNELTNRPLTMEERIDNTVNSVDFGGGLGVIKPKGGNWLSGKYGPEAQLKALKKSGSFGANNPEELAGMMNMPLNEAQAFWASEPINFRKQALNSWVDNQLTKYVKNDMGAPTDPIRKLADAWQGEKTTKLAQADAKVKALRAKQEAQAATRGVPEEYLTRTRQDVLAAEEARDLIAENTGLHYAPNEWLSRSSNVITERRKDAGFPAEGMAATDTGSIWENAADNSLGTARARNFQNLPSNLEVDPWLAKTPAEAPIYNYSADANQNLGFSHLADELSNSLREGRLTPEQLAKMPIDQAVKHVAEVNALRAVTAKKKLATDMQGMPLHKDYPDQGMSWRQLRMPGDPNEWQRQFNARNDALHAEAKAQGKLWSRAALNKKIEAELGPRPYDRLQKWLTQEGDAMGHCVGGYCDDVAAGHSSIYSLRDAKGQPHVTIETTKAYKQDPDEWFINNDSLPDEFYSKYPEPPLDRSGQDSGAYDSWVKQLEASPEYQAYATNDKPIIAQIKGKDNQAPNPEHLPFIQDFIRSGKWGDIGDAANTGLTPDEINQILKGQ